MILSDPDFWDDRALKEVIAYGGIRKQVWDNSNSVNTQIFAFGHKDFLRS